jgi:hypothetical protein
MMTDKEVIDDLKFIKETNILLNLHMSNEVLDKAIKEIKGLKLLVEWAIECGFGYDNIPEIYEEYEEEIKDMDYTEGLIYIATREAENDK